MMKLGVVMDFIGSIHYHKDSTLAMLQEAQTRGFEIYYFELSDLSLRNGIPFGEAKELTVFSNEEKWYEFGKQKSMPLSELDIILMRKDPPVNDEFIYSTHILEHAE